MSAGRQPPEFFNAASAIDDLPSRPLDAQVPRVPAGAGGREAADLHAGAPAGRPSGAALGLLRMGRLHVQTCDLVYFLLF